eukprot:g14082.t1
MVTPVAASLKEVIQSAKSLKERLTAISDAAYSIVGTASEDVEERLEGTGPDASGLTVEGEDLMTMPMGVEGMMTIPTDMETLMTTAMDIMVVMVGQRWPYKVLKFHCSFGRRPPRPRNASLNGGDRRKLRPTALGQLGGGQGAAKGPHHSSEVAGESDTNLVLTPEPAGRLLAVRAPEEHYVDQRREHYELAALFTVAGSISDFYVQVEDNIVAQSGFVKFLRDYVSEKMAVNKTTWNMISLGRDGLNRKVVRSKHLIRFAELLPIFPEVPPDSLLWDFVDVINNQSAPKACYIAFSATKMKRHDVILQYHKAEAIIEHVGDVSSLEGKVQRIHDASGMELRLWSCGAEDIFAGFHLDPATSNQLQNLYGVHGNSQGMGGAPAVTILAQTLAEVVGKGTFEVVFKRPLSVQMINLRMGGFLRPAAKNKKQPELADPDFDFVFPDAEIALGRGRAPAGLNQSVPRGARPQVPAHGLCSVYEPLTNFSGREFFWRSPTSRPAAGVECVKVTLLEAPKSNVILRTIRIRSLKTTAAARRMTPLGRSTLLRFDRPSLQRPEETAQVFQPKWQDEMRSWAKNVLVAFGSGALFGSLGFVVTMLPRIQPSKVRRRTGEVHRRGRDMVGAQNDPLCSLIHLGSC